MKSMVFARCSGGSFSAWSLRRVVPLLLELLVVLLLLAATAGTALVARWQLPGYLVDLTVLQPDMRLNLVGFHALEQNDQFEYRWTSDYAFVQLPSGYHAAPAYLASVRARAAHPDGPQPLSLLSNERELVTVMPDTAFRTYHVVLPPPPPDADPALRFALKTVPFRAPGDLRDLGVMATSVALQPLPYTNWSVLLLLPLLLLLLWVWLRWQGASFRSTLLLCLPLAVALLLFYWLYRPAPLPYPWLAALAMAGVAVAVRVAQPLAARIALALLCLLISFSGVLWPSWMSDDAFISFRYAQNLVAGHGLVYNVGERVEGYTNFLWTMLAALVLALGGSPVFWAYVAGVLLALALMLLTYVMAQHLLGPAWGLLAVLFVATSQSVLVYTARGAGLETGLFTLLALVSVLFYLCFRAGQRRVSAILCGLALALTTLTRPEGALVCALTLLHLGLTRGGVPDWRRNAAPVRARVAAFVRCLAPIGVAYLLIVVPYFLWRVSYYGDLLPNTFYAKTGGGVQQVLRGLEYAGAFVLAAGGPLLLLALVPLLIRWRLVWSGWQGYLALLVAGYTAYIIAVGGDHFPGERFFVPVVPWLALLLASGMRDVYAWLRRRRGWHRLAPAGLVLLLLLYAPYALWRSAAFDTTLAGNDESVWIWRELGWWLHDHTTPDESVAALGAGAVAYYSNRTTIDLLGLNDRHIARVRVEDMGSGTAGHEKRDPQYVLNVRRPTYIPRMWDGYFGGERVLRRQYTLVTIRTRYGREMQLWQRRP